MKRVDAASRVIAIWLVIVLTIPVALAESPYKDDPASIVEQNHAIQRTGK